MSMSYFVENYEVFRTCFKIIQTAWKHQYDCTCDDCNSYFLKCINL